MRRIPGRTEPLDLGSVLDDAFKGLATGSTEADEQTRALMQQAPNAIEWCVGQQWCNAPSLYEFQRSYQIIRDFFALRCPICNDGAIEPGQAGDCWGRSRAYLENEVLLRWSEKDLEDVCPKCNVTRSEFIEDGLLSNYNQMHLVCGMRCVSTATHVLSARGLVTFDELLSGRESRPLNMRVVDRHSRAIADCVGYSGLKASLKVKTTRGYAIETGEEHRFLVARADLQEQWVRADELEVGDTLVLRIGERLFGTGKLSCEEARVLGQIVANGDATRQTYVRVTSGRRDVLQALERDLKKLIAHQDGKKVRSSIRWRTPKEMKSQAYELEIRGVGFMRWLRACGVKKVTAEDKEVPLAVRTAKMNAVCAFLGAYFSGDGYACLRRATPHRGRASIGCCTVSPVLSQQVQLLLLNLGILTNTCLERTRGFRNEGYTGTTAYRLTIASESLVDFCLAVPWTGSSREREVRSCLEAATEYGAVSRNYGPAESALWLRARIRELDLLHGGTQTKNGAPRGGPIAKAAGGAAMQQLARLCFAKGVLSRDVALAFAPAVEPFDAELATKLRAYDSPKTAYVRVASIDDGWCETADLSVPSSVSFAANGLVTHNSGKSMTAALIGTYVEHVFCSLAHRYPGGLHGYLGITEAEKFEMTFLAANAAQSQDTIWAKYTGFRSNSPWFRQYVTWIKAQEKAQPRTGMKLWRYDEGVAKIINEHPNLRLVINSLNSNSSGTAGRTRLSGFVDELARMKQTGGTQGADEIYRTIESSLATVRGSVLLNGCLVWMGAMVSVTSPMSRSDKAMDLLHAARRGDVPGMYARHYATWEFNPKQPRRNFDAAYAKDPAGAERDFGANPQGAEHPLIHDERRWAILTVQPDLQPVASFDVYNHVGQTGQAYVAARLRSCRRLFGQTQHFVVFDAGTNFDSFAGACGHREVVMDAEGHEIWLTVFDWVMRILPQPGTEVLYSSVYNIVKELSKNMRIVYVAFDHWNSRDPIQKIREELAIPAESESLSDKDCVDFARNCYEGKVHMLPPAPGDVVTLSSEESAHLDTSSSLPWKLPFEYRVEPPVLQPETTAIYELIGLQRDPDTVKVYNPSKGVRRGYDSDDVARTVIHVHKLCQTFDFAEKFDDTSKRNRRRRLERGAAQWDAAAQSDEGGGGGLFHPNQIRGGGRRGPGRGW